MATERVDLTRYDKNRPCKAYKQFARGFKLWADTFNVLCEETGASEPEERVQKVETRVIAIVARLLARLDCESEI